MQSLASIEEWVDDCKFRMDVEIVGERSISLVPLEFGVIEEEERKTDR